MVQYSAYYGMIYFRFPKGVQRVVYIFIFSVSKEYNNLAVHGKFVRSNLTSQKSEYRIQFITSTTGTTSEAACLRNGMSHFPRNVGFETEVPD